MFENVSHLCVPSPWCDCRSRCSDCLPGARGSRHSDKDEIGKNKVKEQPRQKMVMPIDLFKDTWWNNPVASCESIRWPAEAAPAESPNMVTLMVFMIYIITNMKHIWVLCGTGFFVYSHSSCFDVMTTITLWDRRQSRKYSFEPIPAQPPCPEETEDK